jgi:hypothetical protein
MRLLQGRLRGLAVGVASFDVALVVEVLNTLPLATLVDVGDDLAAIQTSDEFHWLVAFGAGSGAARLNGPDDRSTFSDRSGVAHGQ